jgi:hypothetical protein
MPEPGEVPKFKLFSPTMRVDVLVSDWRSELDPALPQEAKETALYGRTSPTDCRTRSTGRYAR